MIHPISFFGKRVNEADKVEQSKLSNSQPLKPKGCQPLKPLECDTFVKSHEDTSTKSDPKDAFVKDKNPFVKTPDVNSTQEFLVTSKPNSSVSFGYKHPLKKAWKKGLLPSVKRGLYGKKLTKSNISLEHITPVSQGGGDAIENLALADREANRERGTKPINEVISFKQLVEYLEQFRDVRVKGINGNRYIQKVLEKAKKVWHFDTN